MLSIKASANDQNRSLFKIVVSYCNNVPISRLEKAFRQKDIKVNGQRTNQKTLIINENDIIVVYGLSQSQKFLKYHKIEIKFKVVYEDENLLIIDKPINTVMHSEHNSLDAQVWRYLKFVQKDSFIPVSIGRLDKVSSGLVIYAKNFISLKTLKENQHLEKTYIFKAAISFAKKQMIQYWHRYNPLINKAEVFAKPCLECKSVKTLFYTHNQKNFAQLITGKKHQIRVTLAKLNAPILGDRRYGGKKAQRVFLHSYKIRFFGLEKQLKYLNNQEIISLEPW